MDHTTTTLAPAQSHAKSHPSFSLDPQKLSEGHRSHESAQTVRATRFELVGPSGKPRAVLDADHGQPSLTFFDTAGKPRLEIGLVPFADGLEGPFVTLLTKEAVDALTLSVDPETGEAEISTQIQGE